MRPWAIVAWLCVAVIGWAALTYHRHEVRMARVLGEIDGGDRCGAIFVKGWPQQRASGTDGK